MIRDLLRRFSHLRLAVDSLAVASLKIVAGVASVGGSLVLARVLLPDDFGRYYLLLSVVTVASTIGLLGLDQAAVRLISSVGPDGRSQLWRTHVRILGPVSLVVTLSVLILGPILAEAKEIQVSIALLALAAVWVLASIWQRFAAEALRGQNRVIYAALLGGLRNNGLLLALGSFVAFGVCWAFRRTALQDLVAATVIVTVGLAVAAVVSASRSLSVRGSDAEASYRTVMAAALPLAGVAVLVTFQTQVDLWLLAADRDPSEVGLYAAARRLAPLVFLPRLVMNGVLAPLINPRHQSGRRRLEETLRAGATLGAAPGLAVAVILWLLPQPVLVLLFGESYRPAWLILMLLTATQAVNLFAGPNSLTLTMLGSAGTVVKHLLLSTGAFLLLGTLLAPGFGGAGVASALLISVLLLNVLQTAAVYRKVGVRTYPTLSLAKIKRGMDDALDRQS